MTNRRIRPLPAASFFAALLGVSLVVPTTQAATWLAVNSDKQARIEVDSASIDRGNDGKVRVWHRETYKPRRMQEAWAFSYATVKQLSELQCEKRLAAPLKRIYFDEDGAEIKSEGFDGKDAQPVVPDSPLERVFNHACKPKKTEPPPPPKAPEPPPPVEEKKPGRKKAKEETAPPPPKVPAAWSYEGKNGAAQWDKLDTDYAICGSGRLQSPVDVHNTIRADLPLIRFGWLTVPLAITDTGHTLRVDATGGGRIIAEGEEFELQYFTFHLPAEEMINGKRAAMGVHFVHQAKSGKIAIIAVPLQEGKENRLIRTLWNAVPLEQGKTVSQPNVKIDPGELIPLKREYYTYVGSLTTPPCTEGVLWLIMKQPVTLSKEQIADFAKIHRNNARPVQQANGRVIKESREPAASSTGKR